MQLSLHIFGNSSIIVLRNNEPWDKREFGTVEKREFQSVVDNKRHLIVFDDIADSFDYKNKHAMIHYLKDISEFENIDMLILTHNYDFFRQCCSRLKIDRNKCFASRLKNKKIILTGNGRPNKEGVYLKNVFSFWIATMKKEEESAIIPCASIPFFRNLDEIINNKKWFKTLTSLLHIKKDTKEIKWNTLFQIYKDIIPDVKVNQNLLVKLESKRVLDTIYDCTNQIIETESPSNSLENKIVLSMAIRLKAEELMLKLLEKEFVKDVPNQTYYLYDQVISSTRIINEDTRELLEKVMILTPEHIHINSFMFEPLIDTDLDYLSQTYKKCIQLCDENLVKS
ncbi:hypothetical protein [Halalkalibacterium ligniniphilum]|uniref:hypothetical protein n=1 Tax=Halalkalibacterium ligniniphilum TaxID=1134413 RepID=UPI000345ACA0|nr:hypothetical protein [Halalkalibacterium ligniniphilum]